MTAVIGAEEVCPFPVDPKTFSLLRADYKYFLSEFHAPGPAFLALEDDAKQARVGIGFGNLGHRPGVRQRLTIDLEKDCVPDLIDGFRSGRSRGYG